VFLAITLQDKWSNHILLRNAPATASPTVAATLGITITTRDSLAQFCKHHYKYEQKICIVQ